MPQQWKEPRHQKAMDTKTDKKTAILLSPQGQIFQLGWNLMASFFPFLVKRQFNHINTAYLI